MTTLMLKCPRPSWTCLPCCYVLLLPRMGGATHMGAGCQAP